MQLHHGDCIDIMRTIPDNSIDLILTDPPYGTTACKWDSIIPFDIMWKQLKRIRKGTVALFGGEPFGSSLRMSNIDEYRYDWIWVKNAGSNFAQVKTQPMKEHENILIFGKGPYYPIPQERAESAKERVKYPILLNTKDSEFIGLKKSTAKARMVSQMRVPSSVQKFNRERGFHPTQKPIALLEYLIKTYTLEGETVLDFTMGSGSTGVACKNLNRNFMGIEKDEKYFEIAKTRLGI